MASIPTPVTLSARRSDANDDVEDYEMPNIDTDNLYEPGDNIVYENPDHEVVVAAAAADDDDDDYERPSSSYVDQPVQNSYSNA